MRVHDTMAVVVAALAWSALAGTGTLNAQDQPVKAELPVLLTSCGQSPGPERVKFFLKRLELDHEFVAQA